jgi:protein TonB
MDGHRDILDRRDSLRRPFYAALGLHAGVLALAAIFGIANLANREQFGDPNSMGGGAIGVTVVKSLPFLDRSGPTNHLASDTQSQVPEPQTKPEPKTKEAVREDPDAVGLKSKSTRKSERDAYRNPRAHPDTLADNQLTSRTGQAASSPLYAPAPGSGGVGVGSGNPFGTRFGAYAALIRDRVAQHWRTDQVDARLRTLPPCVVTFEVQRDGSVRNVRVAQGSGNGVLDYSAQRAVAEAAPFAPLPPQYGGSSATVEFWFTLKR